MTSGAANRSTNAIGNQLRMMDIAGATVYRPMRDLPVMIPVIDVLEKIRAAAEAIEGMLEDGLIVTSEVDMIRLTASQAAADHISEIRPPSGRPLYEAIVDKCRDFGIAGATVFRGLEGYGETAELPEGHLFRCDQPIVISIVDTAERLARLISAGGGDDGNATSYNFRT